MTGPAPWPRRRWRAALAAALLLLPSAVSTAPAAAVGTVLHVDEAAGGIGDGSSWTDAFTALQDALAAAGAGDEIRVAEGTYRPDSSDRTASFALVDGVILQGGYPTGGGPAPDPSLHPTVLSGDLAADDLPGFVGYGENSLHVVTAAGVGPDTVLAGVTVTGGNADLIDHLRGGGILVSGGSTLTIADVTVVANRAGGGGGGIYNAESSPTLVGSLVAGNEAVSSAGLSAANGGGGIYNWRSSPTIVDSTVRDNTSYDGGGVSTDSGWTATLVNTTLSGNHGHNGGALFGDAVIVRSRLVDNYAENKGGGVFSWSDPIIVNSVVTGNSAGNDGGGLDVEFARSTPTIVNSVVAGNTAGRRGGGIHNNRQHTAVVNSVVADNTAGLEGGAISSTVDSAVTVTNSVVWGNSTGIFTDGTSSTTVAYSDVQDWSGGTGNLSVDPSFVGAGDYRLRSTSSLVDSGSDGAVPTDTFDVDGDLDTAEPTPDLDLGERIRGGAVDIGAYETDVTVAPLTLTVTPDADAAGGEEVAVAIDGVLPGHTIGWCQTVPGVTAGPDACGVGTDDSAIVGASGRIDTTARIERFVYVPDLSRWVDCADSAETCGIGAADAGDPARTAAFAPVAFAAIPSPPAAQGAIALAEGPTGIAVTGSGFRPDAVVDVFQCATGAAAPSQCALAAATVVADGAGGFATTVAVADTITPPGGAPVGCEPRSSEACSIVAAEAVDFPGTHVGLPLPLLPSRSITITPDTGVVGGQDVDLVAWPYEPGHSAGWCQTGAEPSDPPANDTGVCGAGTTVGTTVDPFGQILGTAHLERFLYVPILSRWVDCADPAESCGIGAADAGDLAGTAVGGPLEFAPVPPPPATRGAIALAEGRTGITVTGSGFRPDAVVDVFQCAAGAAHPSQCALAAATVTADGSGGFVTTVTVADTITPPGGAPVACEPRTGEACSIVAAEAVDFPGTHVGVVLPPTTPAIVLGVASVTEGDAGTVTVEIPVRLSEPTTTTVTVDWSTVFVDTWSEEAARPGEDYVAASGSLSFAPGETSTTIPVTVSGDTTREIDELVVVLLENPVNGYAGGFFGLGFAEIVNDDPIPDLQPGGALAAEGDAGTATLEVPVTLTNPSARTVTVEYETVYDEGWGDLAARPGEDYDAASGLVTFAPGATTATVALVVHGDATVEPDEWIVVRFRRPSQARLPGGWSDLGFGVVANDD